MITTNSTHPVLDGLTSHRVDTTAPAPVRRSVPLSEVNERPVEWVAPGVIPAGAVTLLVGQGGLGKTTLALWWAARATRGQALIPGTPPRPPMDVLIVSCEDDAAEVIKPRARLAGADMPRIHTWDWDRDGSEMELPDHAPDLLHEVDRIGAELIIIDPITAVVSGAIDSHKTASLRRMLRPLAVGMSERGAALLAIAHPNKGRGGDVTDRTSGSGAWVQAARAALVFGPPPGAEDDEPRRVVAVAKSNYGPTGAAFNLSLTVPPGEQHPAITWDGPSTTKAWDLLAQLDTEERTLTAEASDWLSDYLTSGPRPRKDVFKDGAREGYSAKTLRTARERLGVTTSRTGFPSTTTWALPDRPPVVPDPQGTTRGHPSGAPLQEPHGQGDAWPQNGAAETSHAVSRGQGPTALTLTTGRCCTKCGDPWQGIGTWCDACVAEAER